MDKWLREMNNNIGIQKDRSGYRLMERKKNLLASLAHSHRALRVQLASLARMSAPGARDLMVVALRAPIYVIVALRAPTYVNFALRAQCCVLHSA